ncbi:hypothetical protein [Planomonospora sp. ID82291]|uniref:hypothetical protein n=1 Tax=Planomonospora sp. ID82291 TaxID=2738136 RepID=UPI0018C3A704|nr:hypothetical protein [Planomonospora sp. ID82291]MBG0815708.1 hypothetical protein [Planomonospora sp. ID82291]
MPALADPLPLSVQAPYPNREVPAAVIVILQQTWTIRPALASGAGIDTAASPADLHVLLRHPPTSAPSQCATAEDMARTRTDENPKSAVHFPQGLHETRIGSGNRSCAKLFESGEHANAQLKS